MLDPPPSTLPVASSAVLNLTGGGNGLVSKRTQLVIEGDIFAPTCLPVKECARHDRLSQHGFQAERLGTKLDFVRVVGLGPAPLVLHGKRLHRDGTVTKLHDIRHAGDAKL